MRTTPLSLFFDLARLAFEANMVVGLRMMKLAVGDSKAIRESHLMVTEKLQAAAAIMIDSAFAFASGKSMDAISRKTVSHYRRKVRANHRRLSR